MQKPLWGQGPSVAGERVRVDEFLLPSLSRTKLSPPCPSLFSPLCFPLIPLMCFLLEFRF